MTELAQVLAELRLNEVLQDLRLTATRMEKECLNQPCSHAWGIRHAISTIEDALDDY